MFTKTIRVTIAGLGAAAALALGTGAATAATPVHTNYCTTTFDQFGMLTWQCY